MLEFIVYSKQNFNHDENKYVNDDEKFSQQSTWSYSFTTKVKPTVEESKESRHLELTAWYNTEYLYTMGLS